MYDNSRASATRSPGAGQLQQRRRLRRQRRRAGADDDEDDERRAHGAHPGAEPCSDADQILVAPPDVVGAADHRLALGHQPGQHERHAGPDVGRPHRRAREPGTPRTTA